MNLDHLTDNIWVDAGISLLILVLAVLFARFLIDLVFRRILSRLTSQTGTDLDDALLDAARLPLLWLVFALALEFAVRRLGFIPTEWGTTLNDVFFVLYTLLAFFFLGRVLDQVFKWYIEKVSQKTVTNLAEQILPFLRRVTFAVLLIIASIILLDRFEVEISALVTTLGIGTLAIALAAQAALSDTISGFVIMADRPFRIGDRIELLDLDTWGDVVDIGLRSSRIRTRDNRMVIVPNSVIGKSLIVNYSFPDKEYRIEIEMGVAYGSDLEVVRETIITAVRGVEGVLLDHPIDALLLRFGDSALIFRVRWWIESYVDTRRMFDKVNTAIYSALEEAGIELPFPQQEVHHKLDPVDLNRIKQAWQSGGD